MIYKTIETRIKQAIDTREKGELSKSRRLFESLLKDLEKQLKKDSTKKLKYIYATAMGEYVIQYRLEATRLYDKALELGKSLLKYDRQNKIGNPLSVRAVSNTLLDIRRFEESEEYLRQLIPIYKENSGRQGDIKAHLAYCLFRIGKVRGASKLIDEAIEDIEKNTAKEEYFSVWQPYALMVKALIYNSKEKFGEAMKYAKKASVIAKIDNRVFRIKQAQELVDLLKKKKN